MLILYNVVPASSAKRLKVLQDWPFHVGGEGETLQEQQPSELAPIPEEGAGSPEKLGRAAACLLFLLGLEVAGSSQLANMKTGAMRPPIRGLQSACKSVCQTESPLVPKKDS